MIVNTNFNNSHINMFVKLAVFACSVAAVVGSWNGPLAGGLPAHQFPAGVSPQACPNFPHCSNPSLSANPNAAAPIQAHQGGWNGPQAHQGGWNGQQGHQGGVADPLFTGAYAPHNSVESGQYVGDGDYKGEGLPESGAFGAHSSWTQDNNNHGGQQWGGQQAWNAQPAPAWNAIPHGQPAQLPAGVDAHSCPNYPICH